MRVASFNLYNYAAPGTFCYGLDRSYADTEWAAKEAWIEARLIEIRADTVGFQEVFSVDALRALCARVGLTSFRTVEAPTMQPGDAQVFSRPVNAIASCLPIIDCAAVPFDDSVRACLTLPTEVGFTRAPIRATIDTPAFGPMPVYVLHLKSNRPMGDPVAYTDSTSWRERVLDTQRRCSRGMVAANLRRGGEAAAMYTALTNDLRYDLRRPIVVLGDLNNDDSSLPLSAILMERPPAEIGGVSAEDWPAGVSLLLQAFRFCDAARLPSSVKGMARRPTHYHDHVGSVLDYVLVSSALVESNPDHVGRVSSYEVIDGHIADGTKDKTMSDHAIVVAELTPRWTRAQGRQAQQLGQVED